MNQKKQPDGTYKLLGVLNINNMIPVSKEVLEKVDLAIHKKDSVEIKKAKILMQKQIAWCRDNADVIVNRANKVYDMVVNHPEKNSRLVRRSTKFKELEEKLKKTQNKE